MNRTTSLEDFEVKMIYRAPAKKTCGDIIENTHSSNDVVLTNLPGAAVHPYSGDIWWGNIGYLNVIKDTCSGQAKENRRIGAPGLAQI